MPGTKPRADRGRPELVLLYDAGEEWREIRRPLPDGGSNVLVEIESPGLKFESWAVAVLRTKLRLARVGTSGASWALFDPADAVQMWLGQGPVEAGIVMELVVAEAS